eukprot:GEMP01017934.1.p1 GENE.GEMP01017934.1~~GEMP01017934.1.p1  ORF type:complete len:504 (+),score=100.36 GEMP01017934.1:67-1578(+)
MVTKEDVLQFIADNGSIEDTLTLANDKDWDHNKVVGCVKSLASSQVVAATQIDREVLRLSDEGRQYVENGTPEAQVYRKVKENSGIAYPDLEAALGPLAKVGFGAAMKAKWISMDKSKFVTPVAESIADTVQEHLKSCDEALLADAIAALGGHAAIDALKKRKLVQIAGLTSYKVEKTSTFSTEIKNAATDLTHDMIVSGTWKNETFKPYNLDAMGSNLGGGHLHPLLKVRQEIRQILLLMGFEEMPTNNYVESSFWNFDGLFQPQQHPARDSHDTFFIKSPARTKDIPEDYMHRVKKMHEEGGDGSIGWRYCWSENEARKNLLRTHTTAVSTRMLYQVGEEYKKTGVFRPRKFFSIDRVFRNETLDATHLAEFHQIEGVVCDRGLTLGHLIGVIKEFFRRQGITNLRFKPAYNPYTEPSMEIFGYHDGLNKWIEVGNSGIFRPEMCGPLGLPDDVQCIAWGLSLERPTMIQYGISNIRDLFGPGVDIQTLKRNPVCWVRAAA